MTHIWISSQLTHSLGWTLLHFLWQGLALAAIASACMAVCRAASTKYVVALIALLLMLAMPVITFSVLQRSSTAASGSLRSFVAPVIHSANSPAISIPATPSAAPSAPARADILLLLVETWFAGVVFFSLRTAGGLILVERMRRHQSHSVDALLLEECRALQRRMGITRAIRFCECVCLEAPAVIGWFRPVVLLPLTALSGLSEDQLSAVVAHELAHIRRFDCFVNLFQIATETLLFYHPAVWWLNKRIRAERENCCDDAALVVCGNPIEYARALTLMEEWRQQPVMVMAANGSPLMVRVARLLGIGSPRSGIRNAGIAASLLCLAGALLAANGLMAAGRSFPLAHTRIPTEPALSVRSVAPGTAVTRTTPLSDIPVGSRQMGTLQLINHAQDPSRQQNEGAGNGRGNGRGVGQGQGDKQSPTSTSGGSYVDQLKDQGYDNLTANDLISLKVQGVTPEYIQQVKALGLHPTINELISMRVQGIDPQYIKDMRATGFNPDINQLISLRVQGVTPEYVRNMRAAGIDGSANQFISLKVQGVTPEYVKEMKAAGVNVDTNQLISMKVQGLDAQYVQEMKNVGLDANTNQLISMKVQGLTRGYMDEMSAAGVKASVNQYISMLVQGLNADYIKQMVAAGVRVDTNQLISMRVQGITPEYIKEMKAAGVTATNNQLIGMRVEGVTPEYVKALQSAGLQNLDANDYVRAKVAGITPDFIEKARSHGFKDLSIEKLIELKNADIF